MEPTLIRMLSQAADEVLAITAPARPGLSFGALHALVQRTLETLNGLGIGRNDRVAIVLGNGPEMASCFIAAACGVATAPLNPAYRADEFEFYLSDLNAKALIVERGSASPAIDVAAKLGVRVIDLLVHEGAGAGSFVLEPRDGSIAASTAEPTW